MLHAVCGMDVTFCSADAACRRAGLKGIGDYLGIGGGLSRDDVASGSAEVSAIEIEPDAAGEGLGIRFAQAGIGAGRAGLGAVEAGADTGEKRIT
jgi:hypothetical protein